jgi:diguanylate cyclase (GGDEF)-like protein
MHAHAALAAPSELQARATVLVELGKQDRNKSRRAAESLLGEISADDTVDEAGRLTVLGVLVDAYLGDGYDHAAAAFAQRGLAIATRRSDATQIFAMRAALALLDFDTAQTDGNLKALDALALQANDLQDDAVKLSYLNSYYEMLAETPRIGESIRGMRTLDEWLTHAPALQYYRRRLLLNHYRFHHATGDYASAMAVLRDVHTQATAVGDTQLACFALHQLGRISGYQADYALSNTYLIEARDYSEKNADHQRVFLANRNLARNYVLARNFAAAQKSAQLALAVERADADPYLLGTTLLYLARAQTGLGDLTAAQATYARAHALERDGMSKSWLAESHRAQSDIDELRGDAKAALAALRLADLTQLTADREETARRVAAIREISKASELDYRNTRLELERNQAQLALRESESRLRYWVMVAAIVALLFFAAGAFAWRKRHQANLFQAQLQTDALTTALSRTAIEAYLAVALRACAKSKRPLALLLLDVNSFKRINDTHGHAVGDDALKWVVRRVRDAVRKEDRVGRLGGDEFMVVLPGASASAANETAERIKRFVAEPAEALPCAVGVSVGVGVADANELIGADLIKRADAAMYAQKRNRKSMQPAPLEAEPSR